MTLSRSMLLIVVAVGFACGPREERGAERRSLQSTVDKCQELEEQAKRMIRQGNREVVLNCRELDSIAFVGGLDKEYFRRLVEEEVFAQSSLLASCHHDSLGQCYQRVMDRVMGAAFRSEVIDKALSAVRKLIATVPVNKYADGSFRVAIPSMLFQPGREAYDRARTMQIAAMADSLERDVIIQFSLDAQGQTVERRIRVRYSPTHDSLALEAALRMTQWRAYQDNGRSVPSRFDVMFRFLPSRNDRREGR